MARCSRAPRRTGRTSITAPAVRCGSRRTSRAVSSWSPERVSQVEERSALPHARYPEPSAPGGAQVAPVHERLAIVSAVASEEERRSGEEEVVEEVLGEQAARERRSALGEKELQSGVASEVKHFRKRNRIVLDGDEPGFLRKASAQPGLTARARQDERTAGERRMRGIDVAGSGEEDEPGMLGEAPLAPERRPCLRALGKDALRVPEVRAGLAERARADENAVRAGAQEAHHEPVALVVAADDPARFGALLQGDDPVHGGDEVGEDARAFEPEIASVGGAQLRGESGAISAAVVEQLELRQAHRGRSTRKY